MAHCRRSGFKREVRQIKEPWSKRRTEQDIRGKESYKQALKKEKKLKLEGIIRNGTFGKQA